MQIEYFNDTAFARDPMYGITYNGEGYQVRIGQPDRSFYFSSYFSLSRYPDALERAQKIRDKVIRSKAFRTRQQGTRGPDNTTGFVGVSCSCGWQDHPYKMHPVRSLRFSVRTNDVLANGKGANRSISGVRKGVWLAYRQAVKLRHEIIGKRATNKLIAQRYDQVFIPNYRERLEALELDWRRE